MFVCPCVLNDTTYTVVQYVKMRLKIQNKIQSLEYNDITGAQWHSIQMKWGPRVSIIYKVWWMKKEKEITEILHNYLLRITSRFYLTTYCDKLTHQFRTHVLSFKIIPKYVKHRRIIINLSAVWVTGFQPLSVMWNDHKSFVGVSAFCAALNTILICLESKSLL